MKKLLLLGLVFLASCTTTRTVYVTKCEENKPYTQQQQQQAYNELLSMPSESAVVTMLMDYSRIRDANTACLNYEREKIK